MFHPTIAIIPLLFAATLSVAAPAKRGTAITATVKNGTYTGLSLPTLDQEVFYGVAFAQPPVGSLRLRQALPLNATWTGAKDATTQADGVSRSESSVCRSETGVDTVGWCCSALVRPPVRGTRRTAST